MQTNRRNRRTRQMRTKRGGFFEYFWRPRPQPQPQRAPPEDPNLSSKLSDEVTQLKSRLDGVDRTFNGISDEVTQLKSRLVGVDRTFKDKIVKLYAQIKPNQDLFNRILRLERNEFSRENPNGITAEAARLEEPNEYTEPDQFTGNDDDLKHRQFEHGTALRVSESAGLPRGPATTSFGGRNRKRRQLNLRTARKR